MATGCKYGKFTVYFVDTKSPSEIICTYGVPEKDKDKPRTVDRADILSGPGWEDEIKEGKFGSLYVHISVWASWATGENFSKPDEIWKWPNCGPDEDLILAKAPPLSVVVTGGSAEIKDALKSFQKGTELKAGELTLLGAVLKSNRADALEEWLRADCGLDGAKVRLELAAKLPDAFESQKRVFRPSED